MKKTIEDYPKLMKEWHQTKNDELQPKDFTQGSGKKVWWQCEEEHEWEAMVINRTKGHSCPYCSGKKLLFEKSLASMSPEIAKEWHPTKNGEITPDNISYGTGRKAWWRCEEGHEWESKVNSRTSGKGCPLCSGKVTTPERSLTFLNSRLAKEWHPTKNSVLTPNEVSSQSNKKVWWKCDKNHEWKATINSRTHGNGCPYCSGHYVSSKNSLVQNHPELAGEFDSDKNAEVTVDELSVMSNKKVWWKCKHGFCWKAPVYHRTSSGKHGHPSCSSCKTECKLQKTS